MVHDVICIHFILRAYLFIGFFDIFFQHIVTVDKRDNLALPTKGYFIKLAQVYFDINSLNKYTCMYIFRYS